MAVIIDGKAIAETIGRELSQEIAKLKKRPKMTVYMIGSEDSSWTYANALQKSAEKLGIVCDLYKEDQDTDKGILLSTFAMLEEEEDLDGILLLRPMKDKDLENALSMLIPPDKDIDCANPFTMGLLAIGQPMMYPPTPAACIEVLKRNGVKIAGKVAAVVGRSNVVGKPLALMLSQKDEGDATVIICHSRTKNLQEVLLGADIVFAAAGSPKLIKANMIKEGAIVVDAGINWVGKQMIGDVDFDQIKGKASMITPVPGGIGPVTRMMLFKNLIEICRNEDEDED